MRNFFIRILQCCAKGCVCVWLGGGWCSVLQWPGVCTYVTVCRLTPRGDVIMASGVGLLGRFTALCSVVTDAAPPPACLPPCCCRGGGACLPPCCCRGGGGACLPPCCCRGRVVGGGAGVVVVLFLGWVLLLG